MAYTTYQKYASAEGSVVYSATGLNRMNFKIDYIDGLTDLSKSYFIFNTTILSSDRKKNGTLINNTVNPWRWGNNGYGYNAASIFRNLRIDSSQGTLENIVSQNQLCESMKLQYEASKSLQKSQDIINFLQWSSADENNMFSCSPWITYENDGTPTNPGAYSAASVIIPLNETASGLARAGPLNLRELEHNNLQFRVELEDSLNVLDIGATQTATIINDLNGSTRTLCWNNLQMPATYAQTIGQNNTYELTIVRPQNYQFETNQGATANNFPLPDDVSAVNIGFIQISYLDSNGVNRTVSVPYSEVANDDANITLTLQAGLSGANGVTGNGGLSEITVLCPMAGNVVPANLNQVVVYVPSPQNSLNTCPFVVGQTVKIWSAGLTLAANNEIYQITGITKAGNVVSGVDKLDKYTLTLDAALAFTTPDQTNMPIYMAVSPNATATWFISNPLLALASLQEPHHLKLKRQSKMNGGTHHYMTWEMESYSASGGASFQRQWILNSQTYCTVLTTPASGSMVSTTDNVNQYRVLVNSRQLTNRSILIDGNGAGSQHTDWIKSVLKDYAMIDVKQIQQIPPDPDSVVLYVAPINDMRLTEHSDMKTPYVLEYQLNTPSSTPASAKTMYLFKLVLKQL
jgi:hypothetical protein